MHRYPWLYDSYCKIVTQHLLHRGHHAILIQTVPGMAVDILILFIARWLMCENPLELDSCGECHACRLMKAGNHPDWYHLESDKNKNIIGIDVIRKLIEKLYHHSRLNGAKVVFIVDIQKLTESASGVLLKTLEEPPLDTWFFLINYQPSLVLSSLRSRCILWYLSPPNEEEGLAWLKNQSSGDITKFSTVLRLSSGAPLVALSLLNLHVWESRLQFCNALSDIVTGDFLRFLPILNYSDVLTRIYWVCSFLIDAGKWHQGARTCISNLDQEELVMKLSNVLSPQVLSLSYHAWMICRSRLLRLDSVNVELLLTEQLLHWEVLTKNH
ncbi:DNA polymerase III subunit delta' C-terminal domain-containing protein [Candidatus Erwinia haradaeae]|uniref:DNA polymerase III subunit delta' n=1 Tax=Candidatus Erwinia haradaeae TaxID=1922217 RepID=A0A803FUB5_9GAMM|nr:DNA polymerase III subunit delta' C-terminal domain-containing protein [Candidatus Erwinia haradaeae]VFP88724.1 DNA polymerase III subunit delta' [Candidatus Erwinia haradaeae]